MCGNKVEIELYFGEVQTCKGETNVPKRSFVWLCSYFIFYFFLFIRLLASRVLVRGVVRVLHLGHRAGAAGALP